MQNRIASIKETGEELTAAEWDRFDAAVAELKAERRGPGGEADGDVTRTRLPEAEAQAVA